MGLDKPDGGGPRFLFDAVCWPRVVGHSVVLRQVFRQKEMHFVTLLEVCSSRPRRAATLCNRAATLCNRGCDPV